MALNIPTLNSQFVNFFKRYGRPYDNLDRLGKAEEHGIWSTRLANVSRNQNVWRVVGIYHLPGQDNGGNHNVFCDVLDDKGNRLNNMVLELKQGHLKPVFAVIDKPAWEAGTNFPIHGATPCSVRVIGQKGETDNLLPSEQVHGLRINFVGFEDGNSLGHNSFYLVFQRLRGPMTTTSPVVPKPKPKPNPVQSEKPDRNPKANDATVRRVAILTGRANTLPSLKQVNPLYEHAQNNRLGFPVSETFTFCVGGETYLGQAFSDGVVWTLISDWGQNRDGKIDHYRNSR